MPGHFPQTHSLFTGSFFLLKVHCHEGALYFTFSPLFEFQPISPPFSLIFSRCMHERQIHRFKVFVTNKSKVFDTTIRACLTHPRYLFLKMLLLFSVSPVVPLVVHRIPPLSPSSSLCYVQYYSFLMCFHPQTTLTFSSHQYCKGGFTFLHKTDCDQGD